MQEAHPPIVQHVARIIQDELGPHLEGVLWTGSRAYGEPWPNSDWDFFVIHDEPWRQRRLFTIGEDEIELFFNPVDQIRHEFAEAESATVGMFARGQVIVDRSGLMATLHDEAERLWRGRPPLWTSAERDQWRYDTMDLLKDVEDLLTEDPDAASYLMGITLETLLDGWYRAHQYWQPKSKYLLADLARINPELALQCRVVISHRQSVTRRFSVLQQLVDSVHQPLGGRLKSWQTEREATAPFPPHDGHNPQGGGPGNE